MKNVFLLVLALLALDATRSRGADRAAANTNAPAAERPKWVFSLLPKSLQKNPLLDMTVFTEVTPAGKKFETPSREHPAYYESHAAGYRQVGESVAGEHAPPPAELIHALTNALAATGYLHTDDTPQHRPALLLIFHWGSHNRIDPTWAENDPLGALKNLIERARLVGGEGFAQTLLKAYNDDALSSSMGANMGFTEVYLLSQKSDTMRHLIDQSLEDVYFVVASAYDYAAAAEGRHVLLWRTSMTASALGVSMKQTLPPLIANASPYFGHETVEAVPITKRGMKEGTVEIGEPTVLGTVEDATIAPAAGETTAPSAPPPTPAVPPPPTSAPPSKP